MLTFLAPPGRLRSSLKSLVVTYRPKSSSNRLALASWGHRKLGVVSQLTVSPRVLVAMGEAAQELLERVAETYDGFHVRHRAMRNDDGCNVAAAVLRA